MTRPSGTTRFQSISITFGLINCDGRDTVTASNDELRLRHYTSTSDRKWGYPYLTREFFDEIGARLADRILLVMATGTGDFTIAA